MSTMPRMTPPMGLNWTTRRTWGATVIALVAVTTGLFIGYVVVPPRDLAAQAVAGSFLSTCEWSPRNTVAFCDCYYKGVAAKYSVNEMATIGSHADDPRMRDVLGIANVCRESSPVF